MNDYLVVYYSKTGSNKYLARKLVKDLNGEIEEIRPRLNLFIFLLMMNIGNKSMRNKIEQYEKVILCGPIWMGKLISPLKGFIKKYKNKISQMYFLTCCGSGYEVKDDKFGHARVFAKVKELMGDNCVHCEALPIGLVLPEDKKKDSEAIMNTRLTDNNFNGEIEKRYNDLLERLKN